MVFRASLLGRAQQAARAALSVLRGFLGAAARGLARLALGAVETARIALRVVGRLGRWFISSPWRPHFAGFLLMLFGFAWLYSTWPGEFYHATLTREPAYRREAYGVQEIIQALYQDSTLRVPVSLGQTRGFVMGFFRIDDLVLEPDDALSFRLGSGYWTEHPGRYVVAFQYRIKMSGLSQPFFPNRGAATKYMTDVDHMIPLEFTHLSGPVVGDSAVAALLKCPTTDISPGFWTCLPGDLIWRIEALRTAVAGQPVEFPGHFARMAYLSAGIVTTAGFGDIQPLTTRARWAAVIEALLGVLIVGSYVNSLTHGGRSPRGSD
jgi:hypothetical protein